MNAIEYALVADIAQREGGLQNVLDDLVRMGKLESVLDPNGVKRYGVVKPPEEDTWTSL